MLVLSRWINERILIGDNVVVTVCDVRSNGKVRLGIEAPNDVQVDRAEYREAVANGTKPPPPQRLKGGLEK